MMVIYTYDRFNVVTIHSTFVFAYVKALYQALVLGIDSYVDYYDGKVVRTKYYLKGWLPFKNFLNDNEGEKK